MMCTVWSSLAFYLTRAGWETAPNLKQNQFGNQFVNWYLIAATYLWKQSKKQFCILEWLTDWFAPEGSTAPGRDISVPLQGVPQSSAKPGCHYPVQGPSLRALWEQGVTLVWGNAMATMVPYLAVGFYPASLWTGTGTNQLKLMIGIFHMKGCSGVKSGNQAVPCSLDFP